MKSSTKYRVVLNISADNIVELSVLSKGLRGGNGGRIVDLYVFYTCRPLFADLPPQYG